MADKVIKMFKTKEGLYRVRVGTGITNSWKTPLGAAKEGVAWCHSKEHANLLLAAAWDDNNSISKLELAFLDPKVSEVYLLPQYRVVGKTVSDEQNSLLNYYTLLFGQQMIRQGLI